MRERLQADILGWDGIADHRTGTAGDRATAEWLADQLRGAGVAPRLDTFPFERRVLRDCAVTVGDQSAEGVPLFDGPLTDAAGIEGTLAPFAAAAGGIGVGNYSLSGGAAAGQLERMRRAGQANAIVAYATTDGAVPGLQLANAPSYATPFGPPVLQVASEHGSWLEDAAGACAAARFVAHGELERTTACNVRAVIAGRKRGLLPLVVVTPRSGWWTCTAERGGGIAAWLACAHHFVAAPPARDVILLASTGHELGHLGLAYFLARQPPAAAHAWLHLGANFAARGGSLRLQASAAWLPRALAALAAAGVAANSVAPAGTQPVGEAANIHAGGGTFVSFVGAQRWFHHPDDRWPHAIDMDRVEHTTRAALDIATALADG